MVIYLDFYSAGKNFSSFAAFEKIQLRQAETRR
jgi:hypothetical protein